jgi:hypothetical protein
MEGFSCVTPVTGLNRPNTGKEDDDDEEEEEVRLKAINGSDWRFFIRNHTFFTIGGTALLNVRQESARISSKRVCLIL